MPPSPIVLSAQPFPSVRPPRDVRRADGWLTWPASDARTRLRLFCFPYAGGSGTLFRPWRNLLPADVDVCAIQFPGRSARMREPHVRDMGTLASAIAEAILPLCDGPFAFFGHSLGALTAFEVARHMRRTAHREPLVLVAAGRRAPQIPSPHPPVYALPHDEFVAELRRLDGMPEEVLRDEDLMRLVLPALRADFELCDTYQFPPGAGLTAPIVVYGGSDDTDDTPDRLEPWRLVTSGAFTLRMFPGNHFFIHTVESLLLQTLSADLDRALKTPA